MDRLLRDAAPDAEALVSRARSLVPALRERAAECEALRRLPDATVHDFLEAGLYRIVQPRRFGGFEHDLTTLARCMVEVPRGCGSSGWVLSLTAAHAWWAALYPPAGQAELFGADGDLRMPLIFAPTGRARPADGGWRLSGTWDYASGCDHSNWLAVNAVVPGEEGAPPADLVVCTVSMRQCRIEDNWFVMGLRGTGSKRAVLDEIFVPAARALSLHALDAGPPPGRALHDNPFYGGPASPVFYAELCAVAVGIARGALDAFAERARRKTSAFRPGVPLAETPAAQRRLAEATAITDGAEAMLLHETATYMALCRQRIPAGEAFSLEERTRMQLQLQQAVEACARAVDLLFVAGGSSALNDGEPLQRCYRDLAALRTHYLLDAERIRENWGRLHFGLEPLQRTPGV